MERAHAEKQILERFRLVQVNIRGIDIIGMHKDTPIPQQLEMFWGSVEKKWNLQLLVRDIVCKRAYSHATIIPRSLVSDHEALPATGTGCEEISNLLNWIEEEDASEAGGACTVGCSCAIVQDSPVETFHAKTNSLAQIQDNILTDIFGDNIN